jgi:hypothetical protein
VADATLLSDVQATVDLLNAELEIPSQELAEKLTAVAATSSSSARYPRREQTRCVKNFAPAICAESSSSTTPRASTQTARCFAT